MTTASEPVLLVDFKDGLLSLTLNRPESANALSPALVESMIDAFSTTEAVRLSVIRGEGRHFCAGFDLSDLENLSDGDLLWRFLRIETLLQMVYHAPFATIALAQGQVVGAGADLFAACWQRVCSDNIKLKMPGWNFELALGTRRLAHLIGPDLARDLLIDTRQYTADDCLSCGLATDIVNPQNWGEQVDALFRRSSVLSRQALKDMLNLTRQDTRSDDFAAIVSTAGRPGLKQRIQVYRDRVLASRKAK